MTTTLFSDAGHRNLLLTEFGEASAVQANQHLIVDSDEGIVLDPGGHKVYSKVLGETFAQLGKGKLKYIFLSHEDPDIVAAVNGWLMTTSAVAYTSELWVRFIPHFGLDRLMADRLVGLPDSGGFLALGKTRLQVLPAQFLHASGNLQLYDPTSKILYTGDLGASLGQGYLDVTDFDAHLQFMEPFHRRYMASNRVLRAWVAMARRFDIETIAPQHGAMLRGRELVQRFIGWCETLECGADLVDTLYELPAAS